MKLCTIKINKARGSYYWAIYQGNVTIRSSNRYASARNARKAAVQWGRKHNILPKDCEWSEVVWYKEI